MTRLQVAAVGSFVVLAGAWLTADVLVLRDGRRVQGRVVGIREGVIEFEEQRLFRRGRVVLIDRTDVRLIEFEDDDGEVSEAPGPDRDDEQAPRRPAGLREREVIVSADVAWNDAGLDVRSGQVVYFHAEGRVSWGPGRRDRAQGERNSPRNPNRPIPNRPAAALIGRVGDADPFFIGAEEGAIRMRSSGRLHLGINDDYFQDNSSNFVVTVYY